MMKRDTRAIDGHGTICAACNREHVRAYRAINRAAYRERSRARYAANFEAKRQRAREGRSWEVESLWLAASRWSRHHGLPDAAARAVFIAFASAYDRSTGQALDGPQGLTAYGPRSLRRTELRMRHAGHDPEAAAFAVLRDEET